MVVLIEGLFGSLPGFKGSSVRQDPRKRRSQVKSYTPVSANVWPQEREFMLGGAMGQPVGDADGDAGMVLLGGVVESQIPKAGWQPVPQYAGVAPQKPNLYMELVYIYMDKYSEEGINLLTTTFSSNPSQTRKPISTKRIRSRYQTNRSRQRQGRRRRSRSYSYRRSARSSRTR